MHVNTESQYTYQRVSERTNITFKNEQYKMKQMRYINVIKALFKCASHVNRKIRKKNYPFAHS